MLYRDVASCHSLIEFSKNKSVSMQMSCLLVVVLDPPKSSVELVAIEFQYDVWVVVVCLTNLICDVWVEDSKDVPSICFLESCISGHVFSLD